LEFLMMINFPPALLVAIISVVFSLTANAAKPTSSQMIVSPALRGGGFSCIVSNVTAAPLFITIERTRYDASVSVATHFEPGAWRAIDLFWSGVNINDMYYCSVTWSGEPDDVRATLCRYDDVYPNGMTCQPLN
jgi:hypothetical protein